MAFEPAQLIERLQQIRRPLDFAARQNYGRIAVVQDLEGRLLEWLDAIMALQPAADIAANLDACRRLFTGFDRADAATKRRIIVTALRRLDHLIGLAEGYRARQLASDPPASTEVSSSPNQATKILSESLAPASSRSSGDTTHLSTAANTSPTSGTS